ncbi:MAG: hypothetical protein GY708_21220 [Actinomycetia bacterium]|nr:hypothetical protein [Actinomycetes bacterium]MCP4963446.1 hypothetical protein [Actinomycetes bacterium]
MWAWVTNIEYDSTRWLTNIAPHTHHFRDAVALRSPNVTVRPAWFDHHLGNGIDL